MLRIAPTTTRVILGMLSVAAMVIALFMAFAAPWQLERSRIHMGLAESWSRVLRNHDLEAISGWLPALISVDALLAAGLALTLCLSRREERPLARLRSALATGTSAVLYFFYLRLLLPPASLSQFGVLAIDVTAFALAAGALFDLAGFFATYPRAPRLESVDQYFRDQTDPDKMMLGHWRTRWFAWTSRSIERWLPKALSTPEFGSDAYFAWHARQNSRLFDALSSPRVRRWCIGIAGLIGALWWWSSGVREWRVIAEMTVVISVFLPMLGFGGQLINYRYGDDEDRRRIGWLATGPAIGFFVAAAPFILSITAVVFSSDVRDTGSLYGIPVISIFVVSTMLFVPALVLCFLLSLMVSIFYHGAIDPRLAIRQGTVLTLLGLALTTLFVAVEGAVSSQVVTRFGWPDQTGALIAGTLAALVFSPLRRVVERKSQDLVERLLPSRDLAEGERAQLTVCFVDLSGYTALSARNEPEALLMAGVLHRSARLAAAAHGGALIKTIGDAVMLRFENPSQAVAALTDLKERFARGAQALEIAPLPMHAGLHHGEVVIARDNDLFGAAVNLAARLQGQARDHELLLSDSAQALLDGPAQPRGQLALKNVPLPVEAFALAL